MILHRPLDSVLRSWVHVAAMRALLDTVSGKSGSQVARECGTHPLTALKALTSLEELGLVRRQRGGRDHLFTLRRDNVLVRDAVIPLLEVERAFEPQVFAAIAAAIPASALSVTVFGSTARRESTAQSDLDLCCIVRSATDIDIVRNTLNDAASALYERYHVKISPVILTRSELARRARTPLVRAIVQEGRIVAGKPISTLMNGRTKSSSKR